MTSPLMISLPVRRSYIKITTIFSKRVIQQIVCNTLYRNEISKEMQILRIDKAYRETHLRSNFRKDKNSELNVVLDYQHFLQHVFMEYLQIFGISKTKWNTWIGIIYLWIRHCVIYLSTMFNFHIKSRFNSISGTAIYIFFKFMSCNKFPLI